MDESGHRYHSPTPGGGVRIGGRHHADGRAASDTGVLHWQRPASRSRPMWPLLADDLLRTSHDDVGAAVLHGEVFAVGLAAALLAELVLTDRVIVERITTTTDTEDLRVARQAGGRR
jgi:hypothetical protein